ncbi:hypothetical protein TNCV_4859001 [Trichonephila clavipes]|nr:hypothetical protein TNCV_4859001 [Trichonephila clavipes]
MKIWKIIFVPGIYDRRGFGGIRCGKNRKCESLVYANKPQTLDHLEDNIRRVIADIRQQMLEKVIENWTSRLDYIRASRGSHMPEIIFKITKLHYFVPKREVVGNAKKELPSTKAEDGFRLLFLISRDGKGQRISANNGRNASLRLVWNLKNCFRIRFDYREKC